MSSNPLRLPLPWILNRLVTVPTKQEAGGRGGGWWWVLGWQDSPIFPDPASAPLTVPSLYVAGTFSGQHSPQPTVSIRPDWLATHVALVISWVVLKAGNEGSRGQNWKQAPASPGQQLGSPYCQAASYLYHCHQQNFLLLLWFPGPCWHLPSHLLLLGPPGDYWKLLVFYFASNLVLFLANKGKEVPSDT